MSAPSESPLEATAARQRAAADPATSAWVSANAGSGKTKVLTDRVVRLLLDDHPPARILCLTFTKAAAANMAIKVFDRLGRWVTLDEPALAAEIFALEGKQPDRVRLARARRLFARAVETPGGLKIETIHAFCERLLHLVPFEAQVPARFAVLDEAQSQELLAEAIASVAARALEGEEGALADASDLVGLESAGDQREELLRAAIAHGRNLTPANLAQALDALPEALGLAPGESAETIGRRILDEGLDVAAWRAVALALRAGGKLDTDRADAIETMLAAPDDGERVGLLWPILFTQKGEPNAEAKLVSKAVDARNPDLRPALLAEQTRLIGLRERLNAAEILARTEALHRFAAAVIGEVEAAKRRLGALDFDDLIRKTLALLARGDAAWMLYKLDRGIDHVLVDEAQDTNPEQWEILRHVTADFTAGAGAREGVTRTFFAVGDPKQSIYGFQGAAPREFDTTRRHWERATAAAELAFAHVPLTLSFRSVPAVLKAVDATFAVPAHFVGLSFEDGAAGTVHESRRADEPGTVELWPPELKVAVPDPDAWETPRDEPEPTAPALAVAARIAAAVATWTRAGDESGRIYRAGEILILMRKRGPAFAATIRALKDRGVPVAGADRLDIAEHIAVMDLVAIGRAALRPEDDLTLATALKTPLVALDEDELFRLAADRGDDESLADALNRLAEAGDEAARRAKKALADWRGLARRETPFGFYAGLLGPMGGRARLTGRLGAEAADAVDAFLNAALQAEGPETPSLATFLARFETTAHVIKRELDAERDEVRVMTVHGAKGLEAALVMLIDDCAGRAREAPLLPLRIGPEGESFPVWTRGAKEDCAATAEARRARADRDAEEDHRLLYVAMTRAADRLVIAPFGKAPATRLPWSGMIRAGFGAAGLTLAELEAPYGPIALFREAGLRPPAPSVRPVPEAAEPAPDWLGRPVAPEPGETRPLRPSRALAPADAQPQRGAATARLKGRLVHRLIEILPAVAPEARAARAHGLVAAWAPALAQGDRLQVASDALGVLAEPRLAALFAPGSRAEVLVAGSLRLGDGERLVDGRIDRLAIGEGEILVAEFKTGAPPRAGAPPWPRQAAQLSLYAALLARIHPDRLIRPFLIWTEGPVWRELDEAARERALRALAPGAP